MKACLIATVVSVLAITPSGQSSTPLFVWNASPSVPIGLYMIRGTVPLRGELALVRLETKLAEMALTRGYLSGTSYLLKPIAAVVGDQVCRHGDVVAVSNRAVAIARSSDPGGRPLPQWDGCRVLEEGEVFLLADGPNSFDGRYLGPIGGEWILGSATLLLRRRQ